jgi:hypothetical protein
MRIAGFLAALEQLTIAIAPQGNGGVLRIDWETTRLSIPVTRT